MIAALRPHSARSTPSRHPLQRFQRVQHRKITQRVVCLIRAPRPVAGVALPSILCETVTKDTGKGKT